MKKLLSMLLSVLLSVQLLSFGAAAKELPFTDVQPGSWYYDAVSQCYNDGAMKGVSATRFAPDSAMTRAMFAKALANHSDNYKAPDIPQQFTDVQKGAWYYDIMQWMASLHIITGTDTGKGTPDRPITRAEAATMMYRYSLLCDTAYAYPGTGNTSSFRDYEQIPVYASGAYHWAVSNGIMFGTSKDRLSPNTFLTRAQAAVLLTRISGMNNPSYETVEYRVQWNGEDVAALDLPVSWKTECLITKTDKIDENELWVTFISKTNHTGEFEGATYGGKLFYLNARPAGQPAPLYNHRLLMEITLEGKAYNLYAGFPSDVQSMDDVRGFILMYEQIETILKSIRRA